MAQAIAEKIQAQEGWTDETLVGVLLDYIDNQQSNDAFLDYMESRTLQAALKADRANPQDYMPVEVEQDRSGF